MSTAHHQDLDQHRLELLYAQLERRLFNVVYRWLFDSEEATDVVQDSFIALWDMRDQVRLETVEPLLFRIAIHRAAKRRRWLKLRGWLGIAPHDSSSLEQLSDTSASPHQLLETEETYTLVHRALDALPEKYRQVIVLSEFGELSYEQLAKVLGIQAGTVGSRRHRAMQLLRERYTALEQRRAK
ncbi:MAG: sigma-70 family RNA polymerase sigma factor [Myxococcota bacterium]|jgi:RNA polymerase sigma-70 factor (ECF subfamily)|nr:sigma-70 family RNA polymerase sigma factor [Myxococcota bacterium]